MRRAGDDGGSPLLLLKIGGIGSRQHPAALAQGIGAARLGFGAEIALEGDLAVFGRIDFGVQVEAVAHHMHGLFNPQMGLRVAHVEFHHQIFFNQEIHGAAIGGFAFPCAHVASVSYTHLLRRLAWISRTAGAAA